MLNQLPNGVQQPVLTVNTGQSIDAMYIGFNSDACSRPTRSPTILIRVVQPKLQSVLACMTGRTDRQQDVCAACLAGSDQALRTGGLNRDRRVDGAVQPTTTLPVSANTKGQMVQVTLTAATNLHSLQEFRDRSSSRSTAPTSSFPILPTSRSARKITNSSVSFNGKRAVYIGIQAPRRPPTFLTWSRVCAPSIRISRRSSRTG